MYWTILQLFNFKLLKIIDREPTRMIAYPVCERWGQMNWNSVRWKKIFWTGPTRAAEAGKKHIVPSRQAQRTNQGRTPFICTLCVPIHLSFNFQQCIMYNTGMIANVYSLQYFCTWHIDDLCICHVLQYITLMTAWTYVYMVFKLLVAHLRVL
jgi:hypothetical protein